MRVVIVNEHNLPINGPVQAPVPMKNVLTGTLAAGAAIIMVAVVGITFASIANSVPTRAASVAPQPAPSVAVPPAKPVAPSTTINENCYRGSVCYFSSRR